MPCSEKAEMTYAYHTELLMHAYEIAKVSPKEFESIRSKLVDQRESDLQKCWNVSEGSSEVEPSHQIYSTNTVAQRTPASTVSRAPASMSSPSVQNLPRYEPQRRGAFVEVVPEAGQEIYCPEDDDGTSIYTGERISIGN